MANEDIGRRGRMQMMLMKCFLCRGRMARLGNVSENSQTDGAELSENK
jgi:hypothetical protein